MNNLTLTVSVQDVLLFALLVLLIVAVFVLIQVLKNIKTVTSTLQEVVDKNSEELDAAVKSIPVLTERLDHTLDKVNTILDDSSDSIVESLAQAKTTLQNANRLSSDVADTVQYVATTAVDTADLISSNINRGNSTLNYAKEILRVVRDVLHK